MFCFVFNFWPQYILKFPKILSKNMCPPTAHPSSSSRSTVTVSSTCPSKSQPWPRESFSMSTMTFSHPDWAHWEDRVGQPRSMSLTGTILPSVRVLSCKSVSMLSILEQRKKIGATILRKLLNSDSYDKRLSNIHLQSSSIDLSQTGFRYKVLKSPQPNPLNKPVCKYITTKWATKNLFLLN